MNTELKGRKKSWGRELNKRLIKAISANKKRHFNNKQYQIDNNIIIYIYIIHIQKNLSIPIPV